MGNALSAARVALKSLSALDWGLFLGGLSVLCAGCMAYEAVCLTKHRSYPVARAVLLVAALIWWLYVVYALTLSGRVDHGAGVYLVPFTDWFDADGLRGTKIAFSFLNVLLLAPAGFIISLLVPWKHRILVTVCVCAFLSFGVEAVQHVLQVGDTETEDVLFNVIGAFLGSLAAKPLFKLEWDRRTSAQRKDAR